MKAMKIFLLSVLFLTTCASILNAQNQKVSKEHKTAEATFNVSMHCKGCQEKIERNIPFEKGVKDLKVDLEHKTATVVYDPRKTNEEKLKKAFENLDFVCEKVSSKED
ncbi:MAG: heavy-metal-associated domain-containing protein [Bacteroidota bacterium]|nr:heavy-metal-associated domain-containing protein [Bacteroidota bacterium]